MYVAPTVACITASIITLLQSKRVRDSLDSKLGASAHTVVAIWSLFITIVASAFLKETYQFTIIGYVIANIKVIEKEDLQEKINYIGLTTLTSAILGLSLSYLRSLRFSKV